MAETALARHRGHGEDSIYFDATKNRYVGAVSVGWAADGRRLRKKVRGRTKQEVRDKLKALHAEMDAGVRSSATYTVEQAVADWLAEGLDGRSERTRRLYDGLLRSLLEEIGNKPLRVLTTRDVRRGLEALAPRFSTRSLQITRNSLERAISARPGERSGGPERGRACEGAAGPGRAAVEELHAGAGEGVARRCGGHAVDCVRHVEPARGYPD